MQKGRQATWGLMRDRSREAVYAHGVRLWLGCGHSWKRSLCHSVDAPSDASSILIRHRNSAQNAGEMLTAMVLGTAVLSQMLGKHWLQRRWMLRREPRRCVHGAARPQVTERWGGLRGYEQLPSKENLRRRDLFSLEEAPGRVRTAELSVWWEIKEE